ncbi:hypothetical protein UFOVP263_7 [uncultured Caudovirales phage]|uniref:HNHc domain containing protein n=1 Tax=uncultured Caudovirales phage TaxID=2100421 RepID=A0A6J5TCH5_9CAUD|nr:hypothetical protein UFOVP263_7 [uncultured Caudovirales phage]CAB4242153.1 hypothetical protein UFOVP91_56 [uncultured Caudovirales phage]
MPSTPVNTKCRELGCQNRKTSRSAFCVDHGGGITEKGKTNSKLYSTAAWRNQRKAQLSKSPLCVACLLEGKVVSAEHIDHVFPHRQNAERFRKNLYQSLCPSHHTLKTQLENRGIYLYYAPTGLIQYTDADYNKILT